MIVTPDFIASFPKDVCFDLSPTLAEMNEEPKRKIEAANKE